MSHDLNYYLSLTYPIEIVREDGAFVASHPDLPGCVSQGETADEAIGNLDDAREAWLTVRFEDKLFIAEPVSEEYSGRLSLRMPVSLHEFLAVRAQREGVSLNSYIVTILAEANGAREVAMRVEKKLTDMRSAVAESLLTLTRSGPLPSQEMASDKLIPLTGSGWGWRQGFPLQSRSGSSV